MAILLYAQFGNFYLSISLIRALLDYIKNHIYVFLWVFVGFCVARYLIHIIVQSKTLKPEGLMGAKSGSIIIIKHIHGRLDVDRQSRTPSKIDVIADRGKSIIDSDNFKYPSRRRGPAHNKYNHNKVDRETEDRDCIRYIPIGY